MARWKWVLLIFELILFTVILIHPDVDLPETGFRDGNSPVLAKLQVTTAPVMPATIPRISAGSPRPTYTAVLRDLPSREWTSPTTLRSLLCMLLC